MDATSEWERTELFADLGPASQGLLTSVAQIHRYRDGQTIALEGDPDVPVSYVLSGVVRVFRAGQDGREQTLIRLGPGAAFNMPAAFVSDGRAPANVAALGNVELMTISRMDFARIVSETPEIALTVLRDFAVKLHYLTDLTRDLGLLSVRARLARFLLAQGHPEGSQPVRWTHHEIAAQIGTVREVVSRTMRAFVKEGSIRLERHRIVVVDREALGREAAA